MYVLLRLQNGKCVGILYPCVELYVKLLQMVRVSAVLPLVSSRQRLLSVSVKCFKTTQPTMSFFRVSKD